MKTNNKVLTGFVVAAVIAIGVVIGTTPTQPVTCQGDPAAQIAAMHPGQTFTGSGCYITSGISVPSGVTINGGTYYDNTNTAPLLPVFRVKFSNNVTLENLSINGADADGSYHSTLVGQAGIDVLSSDHTTVSNVTTSNTFGDGITVFGEPGHGPSTNFVADHVTITDAGRQGISPASVKTASFTNITIGKTGEGNGWDFESDLKNIGAANVSISNSTWQGSTNIIEALTGPVVFTNDVGHGFVWLGGLGNTSAGTVTWQDSTLYMLATPTGRYKSAITQIGGTMSFTNCSLLRKAGVRTPTAPLWNVTSGGNLTVNGGTLSPPPGIHDSTSTVTVG